MKSITKAGIAVLAVAAVFVVFVPKWTGVPHAAEEIGFPQEILFHDAAERLASNKAPPPLPPVPNDGPRATETYKNVKVLTDVSAAEFMRLQVALTAWVSPKQGCAFCHEGENYASDAKPTKNVARVMLQMTRHLNADWSNHMAGAGVTCYTCHRGQPVPAQVWFPSNPKPHRPMIGQQDDWQENADTVRGFFPDAGWAEYYLGNEPIAVQSTTVEPSGTLRSWPEAKRIYEMMMQMSDGIGVNCGYCHNSRAFSDWAQSSPYRWNAWYALRLVRDLNRNYLLPIAQLIRQTRQLRTETDLPVMPDQQRGPQQGNGFVICATCHQGVTKPLNGANMVHDYPGLTAPVTPAAILAPHAEAAPAANPG